MNRINQLLIASTSMLIAALPMAVNAEDGDIAERMEQRGERIDARLDARGERIDARLDAKGERINQRLDNRAERAAAMVMIDVLRC